MKCFVYQQCFIAIVVFCCTNALTMEGVSIMGDKEYLRLQELENAVLECRYKLNEGETTKMVTWYHDEFKALTWTPQEPAIIGEGLNEGDAVLTRDDGYLEFARIRSGMEGNYRCEVMTSALETYKSYDYQLLVVDMPEVPEKTKSEVEKCKIKFSWEAPAVKPKPEISCGVWSPVHGFILTATKWMATPYYNGSVAYSLDDETFEIYQMPLDSVIRCEIKITKVDDSHILLGEKNYNFTEVWERGCPPLEVGDGVTIEYDNERITCHAEVKPKDESAPAIAHVKCNEGYMPKYEDFVSSADLVCKDTRWDVTGGQTWNHFDNLLCVERPIVPERPPQKKKSSTHHASPGKGSMDDDHSSGVNGLITPWILILLLGVTLISGVIWGIKGHTKKKEPRYMA